MLVFTIYSPMIEEINQNCSTYQSLQLFCQNLGEGGNEDWIVFNMLNTLRCIHRRLSRSRQLGGLVPVVRLGVPIRCKAGKLKYPLKIPPLVKKRDVSSSNHIIYSANYLVFITCKIRR